MKADPPRRIRLQICSSLLAADQLQQAARARMKRSGVPDVSLP
jgi:hypothetical protein